MSDDKRKEEKEMADGEGVQADDVDLKEKWDALEDQPSEAPGFEGATPRKLVRALFNLGRK